MLSVACCHDNLLSISAARAFHLTPAEYIFSAVDPLGHMQINIVVCTSGISTRTGPDRTESYQRTGMESADEIVVKTRRKYISIRLTVRHVLKAINGGEGRTQYGLRCIVSRRSHVAVSRYYYMETAQCIMVHVSTAIGGILHFQDA